MLFCSGAVTSGSNATRHQQLEDDVKFVQTPTGPKYDPVHAAAAAGRTSQDSMGTTNVSGSCRASLDTVLGRASLDTVFDRPKKQEGAVVDGDINEVRLTKCNITSIHNINTYDDRLGLLHEYDVFIWSMQVDLEDTGDAIWVSVSMNAYGAFIHVALQSGFARACVMCLHLLTASVAIQMWFAYQLMSEHM